MFPLLVHQGGDLFLSARIAVCIFAEGFSRPLTELHLSGRLSSRGTVRKASTVSTERLLRRSIGEKGQTGIGPCGESDTLVADFLSLPSDTKQCFETVSM